MYKYKRKKHRNRKKARNVIHSQDKNQLIKNRTKARHQWLTPAIPATQKA
jgi:hypothetical protein